MSQASASPVHLGFLTILTEGTSHLGGYLLTNLWGRPVEFRLSTAVQPNRVQQILYGPTLEEYLCGELIGKALVEKTTLPTSLVLTDHPSALSLRLRLEVPVAWIASKGNARAEHGLEEGLYMRPDPRRSSLLTLSRDKADAARICETLEPLDAGWDLTEPFVRIREAIAEARKMGVMNRAG